jgi:hypothetical protein
LPGGGALVIGGIREAATAAATAQFSISKEYTVSNF